MEIGNIENNIHTLLKNFKKETFIYDLLLAYDTPKSIIKKLRDGALNISKNSNEVLWKKKVFFKVVIDSDLHLAIDFLKNEQSVISNAPRFLIVTDYQGFLAIDTRTKDSLDISFGNLVNHFDFFLPLAGLEKAQYKSENPADVKAAEKMAKLYDEIKKENPTSTADESHSLNVFLSRLLFCFFAEDTEIFKPKQFVNAITSHTQTDGSDLKPYLERLFHVLNTDYPNRVDLPEYLNTFPYVNGGLFRDVHIIPVFRQKSRAAIIECGELNWKDINPDIFGSMIQAVISTEHRGNMGMHYTSVPNIMKVIESLFLNELYEEFENGKNQPQKLKNLLYRLSKLKIFDPACGSGNFLIIVYKELRLLEIKILQRLEYLQQAVSGFDEKQVALIPKSQQSLAATYQKQLFSNLQLTQFYGIELDDFAHEIATLSLWLAQHQMNMKFKEILGQGNPTLPLKESGKIVHGNAATLDWQFVCPKKETDEIYILGNPPYLGSRNQDETHKSDMAAVFNGVKDYKVLDYISCWFIKGATYLNSSNAQLAFVTTNSICQGDQVSLLWPLIFNNNVEISFAYHSFKWTNNAKKQAAVIVNIIGLKNLSTTKQKFIYTQNHKLNVNNINAYLLPGENFFINRRTKSISGFNPMIYGSEPRENGNLMLTRSERDSLIQKQPSIEKYIRQITGAKEYINNIERFCLWFSGVNLEDIEENDFVKERLEKVRSYRLTSDRKDTREFAGKPHLFTSITHKNLPSIIVPIVSSENRDYIPFGFITDNKIILNSAQVIYSPEMSLFAIISSKLHMVWVRTLAGKLKTDFRYSSALCYNTFPFPKISKDQQEELEKHTYRILEEREKFSEKTLAELYDPKKMPAGLREAHHQLDLAVERCYRSRPFETDEERLEYLFKQYNQMIADEMKGGTLFETIKQTKKSKPLKNA